VSKTKQAEAKKSPEPLVPDPIEQMKERGKSPELAGALAWLLPGLGHMYAGFWVKGLGGLVFVFGLFAWGVILSGGEAVSLRKEGGHEYAFLAQLGAGGPTLLGLSYNHNKIPGLHYDPPDVSDPEHVEEFAARLPDNDTGLLFTMIAGLLNLLLVSDALNGVPGAMSRRIDDKRRERRLAALREELAEERAAKADEAKADDAQADEAQVKDAQADEAKADEAQAKDAQAKDAQADDAKPAEAAKEGEA